MISDADRKKERNLRRMRGVYVLIDPEHTNGRKCVDMAEAVLAGGAAVLQLRDKKRAKGLVLEDAWRMRELCRHANAALIVNDHVDVARLSNATGVHLGQFDIPPESARLLLADDQIVGTSNTSVEQIEKSLTETNADYIAVGSVYRTQTKPTATMFGVGGLRHARKMVKTGAQPLVAIGGINLENVGKVVDCGVDAVCIGTAITGADDPQETTRKFALLFGN